MKIIIETPRTLHEIDQGTGQEDCIYPPKGTATTTNRFFLVCDGMGGHENGEVTSNSVCDSFGSVLRDVKEEEFPTGLFERALEQAYDDLDKNVREVRTPRREKDGDDLTFLALHPGGRLSWRTSAIVASIT
jgi:protein phosphatase